MKKSYSIWGSKCRLLTLLLFVLVVVGSAEYQVNGAKHSSPMKGVNIDSLYAKVFNASRNEEQERLQTGATTNIRHHLLYNSCSDRFVQLLQTGRKGVRAKGLKNKTMEFNKLRFESTPRNTIIIKAVHLDLHICFNKRGKLMARRKHKSNFCEFTEQYSTDKHFTQYVLANERYNWYMGFNKKGKPLRGSSRSSKPEKCFNFLKIDDEKIQCRSGDGPQGVDFCDIDLDLLNIFKPDKSRPSNGRRHRLRHDKHHKRRRKG